MVSSSSAIHRFRTADRFVCRDYSLSVAVAAPFSIRMHVWVQVRAWSWWIRHKIKRFGAETVNQNTSKISVGATFSNDLFKRTVMK